MVQNPDMMKTKPRLSFWQIWNMSFGFLGIQFGFALQNANVSRIFESLGANIDDIPILWIAAPVTGLIIQPIIGHMSDKTWNRLGRRRPYFLVGAILASIALLIMPNSPVLWVAAGMLWIMDASINISMEPFRAFVGDMLPSNQRTHGFAMQSFFIGIGAVIASALPYILTNWFGFGEETNRDGIPLYVVYSFYIGAVVFIGAILYTVLGTKEYSPKELEEFNKAEHKEADKQQDTEDVHTPEETKASFKTGFTFIILGIAAIALLYVVDVEKEVFILAFGLLIFGIIELISGLMQKAEKIENGLVAIMRDFNKMPSTMKQLALVQFFSWFALFAMWIYTTAGVTSQKYNMRINLNDLKNLETTMMEIKKTGKDIDTVKYNSVMKDVSRFHDEIESGGIEVVASMKVVNYLFEKEKDKLVVIPESLTKRLNYIELEYNTGADWVGVCFAVYNGFAAVFAFFLIFLARKTSRKTAHMISLIIGGVSFISVFFVSNPDYLLISFIGIGLVWASILSMPYAILTGALPSHKMGVYMGIFNFFIVIPQIVAASILGFFVKSLFENQAIYAMILGGISLFIAAILVLFVKDRDFHKV